VAAAVLYQPAADLAALALLTPVDGDFFELQDSTGADTDPSITGVPVGLVGSAGLTFRLRYDDPPGEYAFLGYFANDSETRYLKTGTGTVTSTNILDGTIVNADISATAAIDPAKINGTAVITTDARLSDTRTPTDGTVSTAKIIDGAVTSDKIADGTIVNADISASAAIDKTKISGTAITAADTGTVTSTMILDGTIVNADVNASAAIAGTKISPDFGSQNVVTTGTVTAASLNPTGSSVPANGVYLPATNSVAIATNSTHRVRIDSSGNVGIGTTTPGETLSILGSTSTVFVSVTKSGTDACGIGVDGAGNHIGSGGIFAFRVGGFTSSDEKARIDTSGRLLIGTSTAQGQSIFQAVGNSSASTDPGDIRVIRGLNISSIGTNVGAELGIIKFGALENSVCAQISAVCDANWSAGDTPGRLVFSTTADGESSPTERMRINNFGGTAVISPGNVLSAECTAGAGTVIRTLFAGHSSTGFGTRTISFQVWTNGDVQNTNNSYGAISDLKLKENIVDANSQWDDIKALQVRNYNFKPETNQQTHTQIGLIAQEVELVSPGLVSESPDSDAEGNDLGTVTKSVNYSVLYMKAVKALQEAMERIETLEADVAALKAS
jgi:hypothetical protein